MSQINMLYLIKFKEFKGDTMSLVLEFGSKIGLGLGLRLRFQLCLGLIMPRTENESYVLDDC